MAAVVAALAAGFAVAVGTIIVAGMPSPAAPSPATTRAAARQSDGGEPTVAAARPADGGDAADGAAALVLARSDEASGAAVVPAPPGDIRLSNPLADVLAGIDMAAETAKALRQLEEDPSIRLQRPLHTQVRGGLDALFYVAIFAALLLVLVYETKTDPVVELARLLPREAAVLGDAWRRVRDDWLALTGQR